MSALITEDLVCLDKNLGNTNKEVISNLVNIVAGAGRTDNPKQLCSDALTREEKSDTGIPGGVAIPHCKTAAVAEATLAMARINPAVSFGAAEDADIVFFIMAPDGANSEHLKILSQLARSLINKDFTASLRSATTPKEIVSLVDNAINPKPAAAGSAAVVGSGGAAKTIVAVTSCPTGIAHTYMAADALKAAGAELGVKLEVETQGSSGATPLDPAIIKNADAVIFAADVDVRNKGRFAGIPLIASPVKRGIDEPHQMVREAIAAADNPNAAKVPASDMAGAPDPTGIHMSFGTKLKTWLLTGVSYMIPFVAAGGLLTALGFLFGGYDIGTYAEDILNGTPLGNLSAEAASYINSYPHWSIYLGALFITIGGIGMSFLVPALAGYIAYGMADRPGIAPGFIVGSIAVNMGAGFLGGLAGGLLAGAVASALGRLKTPRWLSGLMPVVIIPLAASLISGGLMLALLGRPIAALMTALTNWLSGFNDTSAVLLGIILGLMMCADLGGPINKVAYAFATVGLGSVTPGNDMPLMIMAAVMASGMVPPLALALATTIRKKLFTDAEQENGKAAWLLGASFISEGAIPFAAADPLRVIPASMVGGAITGALTMAFGITQRAPHGGIFVFFTMNNPLLFVLALAIGVIASTAVLIFLKQHVGKKPKTAEASL